MKGICHLAQLFLDTLAVILGEKSEIVGEIFPPALEMHFVRGFGKYQEIYMQIQPSLTKIETFYIVVLLIGANCRFVDYKY